MEILIILLSFVIVIGMSFAVAQISKEKEIGFWTLFAISIMFSPVIGLIVGLTRKNKNETKTMYANTDNSNNQLQLEVANPNKSISEEG